MRKGRFTNGPRGFNLVDELNPMRFSLALALRICLASERSLKSVGNTLPLTLLTGVILRTSAKPSTLDAWSYNLKSSLFGGGNGFGAGLRHHLGVSGREG